MRETGTINYPDNSARKGSKNGSDFLLSMEHDIYSALHAIVNFAGMGKDKAGDLDKERALLYFSRIEEATKRLQGYITGILDLSRLESHEVSLNVRPNDIHVCIDTVLQGLMPLIETKGIKTEFVDTCPQARVYCDQGLLFYVLERLASNAVSAAPYNTEITISVAPSGEKREFVSVAVTDRGPSMGEKEKAEIFQCFIMRSMAEKYAGRAGLDMVLCQEILRAHNGYMWTENAQQGGVTFGFVIPCGKA